MDYTASIFVLVSMFAVCTAVTEDVGVNTENTERCNCPWSVQDFSQLQEEIALLKADVGAIKVSLSEEEIQDNEIPLIENVGDIISLDGDSSFPLPPRPAKIEGFVYATCKPMPNSHLDSDYFQPITGIINMKQNATGGPLYIDIYMYGFRSAFGSLHGFHIHTYGDLKEGCQSTGGHFNPFGKDHGAPGDDNRHVGDLGNVQPDHQGVVNTGMIDNVASLIGENSVIGRAFVIHSGEDDLGLGGFPDSRTTGHAGPRLACCVIGRSEQ
ncbi:superoxide dismutase [Cu-Zn]-like isoform X2 [Apostichopus japonicus]|uniref:superoxide dismutase [Cu-Zn]-like isoform X2 n=1 Tax=Stichopus japonicus TaxID=307972 RepID=UPI003AB470E9